MSSARDKADGTRLEQFLDANLAASFSGEDGARYVTFRQDEFASAFAKSILSEREAGRVAGIAGLKRAGQRLSNAAYNLSQSPALMPDVRKSLREGADEWDAAIRSLALTPREEEAGWRPIEAAPKDGTPILIKGAGEDDWATRKKER